MSYESFQDAINVLSKDKKVKEGDIYKKYTNLLSSDNSINVASLLAAGEIYCDMLRNSNLIMEGVLGNALDEVERLSSTNG